MRVEPHTIGSIIHVTKRGTRGTPIVCDDKDRWRFVKLLYYANDTFHDEYWDRSTKDLELFGRPDSWPEQEPLVKILAWSLMSNHFHLVLKEVIEGGTAKFMQKLCGSMTTHFNNKYKERGSLFQGSYRGKTADMHGDEYLRLLATYVMVKNPFEIYPGGLQKAIKSFDEAYQWAAKYPFCSLGQYCTAKKSRILDKDIFGEIFTASSFKKFSKESMLYKLEQIEAFDKVLGKSDLPVIYD